MFRRLILTSFCVLIIQPTILAADKGLAILNNQAVNAMQTGHLREAILIFKEILAQDPQYGYARDNILIAMNNYGLTLPADRAVPFFKRALEIKESATTRKNLEAALEALKVQKRIAKSTPDDLRLLKFPIAKKVGSDQSSDVDFGPYMVDLQRAIKKNWRPNASTSSKRTVVRFVVARDGTMSALKMHTSSGDPLMDKAALDAVTMAAPFATLPPKAPSSVDIEFSFDFNVHVGRRGGGDFGPSSREFTLASQRLKEAKALVAQNKFDEAVVKAEQATKLAPDYPQFFVGAAEVICEEVSHSRLSNEVQIEHLHHALQLDPANTLAKALLDLRLKTAGIDIASFEQRLNYANKLESDGKLDAAVIEFNQALRMKSDDEVRKKIAAIYVKRNGQEQAMRWIAALKISPTAENHTGLGGAFELTGDTDMAIQEYKKALELDPGFVAAKEGLARLTNQ